MFTFSMKNEMLPARQGKARQGKARQGKARQGKARQGKARQGNNSFCLAFSRSFISFSPVSLHYRSVKPLPVTETVSLYGNAGPPVSLFAPLISVPLHDVYTRLPTFCRMLSDSGTGEGIVSEGDIRKMMSTE
ncbi:TPA: hypothetical protein ACGAD2_004755 [Salmonella enterica subsp. enterica serovar Newport]